MKPETITAWSAVVQAVAAAATVGLTIVLVWTTHRYMKLTKGILEETSKARKASEDSARAALDSAQLMRQQIEEQAGLGQFRVKDTIDSVVSELNQVLAQDLLRVGNVRDLPPVESLLTQQPEPAITHAAKIDERLAIELSQAFDSLRIARARLVELTRWVSAGPPVMLNEFTPVARETQQALNYTLAMFHKAQATLAGKPKP